MDKKGLPEIRAYSNVELKVELSEQEARRLQECAMVALREGRMFDGTKKDPSTSIAISWWKGCLDYIHYNGYRIVKALPAEQDQ